MGFNQLYIKIVGTSNFIEIDTPIPVTEKCAGLGKTSRECLLEKQAVVEGNNMKLFTGIEKYKNEILQIGLYKRIDVEGRYLITEISM